MVMNNGKHEQGTHITKMALDADKSAKNTPNATKSICPNCLPKPKSLGFHWASVVIDHYLHGLKTKKY